MIRVVLVEDEMLVRHGIRGLLSLGQEIDVVAEVSDGEEAISVIREYRPDVVLSDVRMPKRSGIDVLEALRETGSLPPTILLTTFDDDEALLKGIRAGARGFLLQLIANRERQEEEEASRHGFSTTKFALNLTDGVIAEVHRYLRSHRPGILKETKKMGYSIHVKGIKNAAQVKADIDALLLLSSFASRERAVSTHWSADTIKEESGGLISRSFPSVMIAWSRSSCGIRTTARTLFNRPSTSTAGRCTSLFSMLRSMLCSRKTCRSS
jgi:DNA-binding NarL/FixJ family response regulator